jgi:hypothetical protein
MVLAACGAVVTALSLLSIDDLSDMTYLPEIERSLGDDSGSMLGNDDHQSDLAVGETALLTQFLVPVDGYRYIDEPSSKYEDVLAMFDAYDAGFDEDVFRAVSLHGVVADDPSQNTAQRWDKKWEVGYLALVEFTEVMPSGIDQQLAEKSFGGEAIDQLDVGGIKVFVFEDPESPDSRFFYSWLEHGIQGFIDGADREPLERWVRSYLMIPKLAERETKELAARLTDIPGFAYANVDWSTEGATVEAFGDSFYSMHAVGDSVGSIGRLMLIDSDDPELLGRWLTDTLGISPSDEITVGDGRTRHFVGVVDGLQVHAFAWSEAEMGGALTTNTAELDIAKRFLAAFVPSDAIPIDVNADQPEAERSEDDCPEIDADRRLPIFDDFEDDCRIIEIDDITDKPGTEVELVDGALHVTLHDSHWHRFVDLEAPVMNVSASLTATMPTEGTIRLGCYGPRPSLDTFDFYFGLVNPTEVGVILTDEREGDEWIVLNSDLVPREEIVEPMQVTFTCTSTPDGVQLAGTIGKFLLEGSVPTEDNPAPSFQALKLGLDTEAPDPATFILDNLGITD